MKRKLLFVMELVCIFLLGFSLWQVGKELYGNHKQEETFDALQSTVEAPAESQDASGRGYGLNLDAVCAENADFMAWMRIDGIGLSYPIMHTPDRQDYYLRRDFNGNYSTYGTPYMAESCDFDSSDNLIVYGHNMKNGSMFGKLMTYEKLSAWQQDKLITLDTPTEHREYTIFAAILTTVDNPEGDDFDYYNFVNAASEADYNRFVEQCRSLSLYDTGVVPTYGQQLLTLSTCEYTDRSGNGRFVVVACRTDKAE